VVVVLVHSRNLVVKVASLVWVALLLELLIQAVVAEVGDSKAERLALEQEEDQVLSLLVIQTLLQMQRL
jgi:hypothetical protein